MRSRASVMWAAVLVWWTLNGLASATGMRSMRDASGAAVVTWAHALTVSLASAWLWLPLTMAMLWLVQRYPIERSRLAMSLSAYAAAVLAVVIVRAVMVAMLNDWVHWYDELPSFGEVLLTSVWNNLFLGWMLVGVAHALIFAERAHQRERQASELQGYLAQARLQALAAQLNPHFLFNSLNSIAELLHHNQDAAERMLVHLGELLRHSLDTAGTQHNPLRDELRFVRHYVDIERMRLGERLQLDWTIDNDTLDAPVPHLILQPLVENAIRHAVALRITPGRVRISACRRNGCLVLEVGDDGPGAAAAHGPSGIGLTNTRARLECLYGAGAHLTLRTEVGGGTTARLTIPDRSATVS
ncbi:MAG: signlal transduction histidine kinase, LytS [Luteitalea sp.]|nr:signlal transduction histidine kinase, LytS [Luteitalea sp.]